MDENGVPNLSLFGVTETDEPNGLEIVLSNRVTFKSLLISLRESFIAKTKPILEGGTCTLLENHRILIIMLL